MREIEIGVIATSEPTRRASLCLAHLTIAVYLAAILMMRQVESYCSATASFLRFEVEETNIQIRTPLRIRSGSSRVSRKPGAQLHENYPQTVGRTLARHCAKYGYRVSLCSVSTSMDAFEGLWN